MNKKQAQEQFDVVLEKINNLTTEAEKLKAIIDAPESKVWKPEHGEKVWYYNRSGYVTWTIFDCNCGTDISMHELDILYRTEEEAIFERDRKIFMTKLHRWALENNDGDVDWYNERPTKYLISINYPEDLLYIAEYTYLFYGCDMVYFTSKKVAQQAIGAFGESDIRKYMFGVTE